MGSIVQAFYYDGRNARQYGVSLRVDSGRLRVFGEGVDRDDAFETLSISEKLGSAPRVIRFTDGAHCEVTDLAGLDALLLSAGMGHVSLVSKLEAHWRYASAGVIVMFASAIAGYYWGLPILAQKAASHISTSLKTTMDSQTLDFLDDKLFEPSKLPDKRLENIRDHAVKLKGIATMPDYTLVFRHSPAIGPNAFAMPGGTIVVTDELIELTEDDDELIAVLAHEIGHVSENHALRQALQGSMVALFFAWYFGDLGDLAVTAPTAMLQMRYSRDFEREADRYAASLLRVNGLNPSYLADMLEKLQAHADKKDGKANSNVRYIRDYFSTHPATSERVAQLRAMKE